ncbi:MAG: hypothetical protein EOO92_08960 [Pedobacter sp.]|nr:MAG: hypothetical protein EOO92_08960 [Pedobacter sp.]
MNIQEFNNSIEEGLIPAGLSLIAQSLWYDGAGDWKKAHDLIDHLQDRQSAHIHAYLHRKEGDLWNADYWYAKAGKKCPGFPLNEEWQELVKTYVIS